MNQRELIKQRLESVMLCDRRSSAESLIASIKSDARTLLESYMYLQGDGPSVELELLDGGDYELRITARTDRLIDAGKMID